MRVALLALTLAGTAPAPSPRDAGPGVVLERTVTLTLTDTLNRRREIRRKEIVRLRGGDLSITDLTFGERLIIRSGAKKILKADPLRGEYSEYSFEEAAALRKRALDEIRAAQDRVPDTAEAKELEAILEGYDVFRAEPRVELAKNPAGDRVLLVNGGQLRFHVPAGAALVSAAGYFEVLSAAGAFHPAVAAKLKDVGGLPGKGRLRYVLFLERVLEDYTVTASRNEEIDDAEFEVPPGLKKVPLRGFDRAAERKPPKPDQFRRDFREDDIDRQNNPLRQEEKKDNP